MPSGTPTTDGGEHRDRDQDQVLERERGRCSRSSRAALVGVARPRVPRKPAADLADAAAVQVGQRVEARHRPAVEPPDQSRAPAPPTPRGSRSTKLEPRSSTAAVRGEEPPIVVEDARAAARELGRRSRRRR